MHIKERLSSEPREICQDIRFPSEKQTQEFPIMKQDREVRLRALVVESLPHMTILS